MRTSAPRPADPLRVDATRQECMDRIRDGEAERLRRYVERKLERRTQCPNPN